MRKLLNRKIVQQGGISAICHEDFTHYNDIVPDHKNPKGIGGAWSDDHLATTNGFTPCSIRRIGRRRHHGGPMSHLFAFAFLTICAALALGVAAYSGRGITFVNM
jgi:hypothetical protein